MPDEPVNPAPIPAPLFGGMGQPQFESKIEGTWGRFDTPAGRVSYLLTKARLGGSPTSTHAKLTRSLLPAREALEMKEMDFNQLLQRDLDDHRIANDLIPYLLHPELNGPAFFPPVVAVVLPFERMKPQPHFSALQSELAKDPEYGMHFQSEIYGSAFKFQKGVSEAGQELPVAFGVLRWNPDMAKLIVMDGQHRAMALIAIDRTLNNGWRLSGAERYAPFYEARVRELIEQSKQEGRPVDLDRVEVPVSICWFPDEAGEDPKRLPHRAARKLFVDVNKNARPPSEARLVLLSDTELDNIFARELLNRLRTDSTIDLPLYAVEYDNPEPQTTTPRRWSVVTNLEILKATVQRAIFGPEKFLKQMDIPVGGRLRNDDLDKCFREQLDIYELFTSQISDGPRVLERGRLGREYFPIYDVSQRTNLIDAYYDRWGWGILHLLSQTLPYHAHVQAIKDLHSTWQPGNAVATLARDALFEGVGMFWTLEESNRLYVGRRVTARRDHQSEPPEPDVSKAWKIVDEEQKGSFRKLRVKRYTKSDKESELADVDELYTVLNTYAAQVGLILTWAAVHATKRELLPRDLAKVIVEALNTAMSTGTSQSRPRWRVFLRSSQQAFNMLPKMDYSFAGYLRYFWLELLLITPNHALLSGAGLDLLKLTALKNAARTYYLRILVREQAAALQRTNPALQGNTPEVERLGAEQAVERLADALHRWFGQTKAVVKAELQASLQNPSPVSLTTEEITEQQVTTMGDQPADELEPPAQPGTEGDPANVRL